MNAFNQISLRPGRRTKRRAAIMMMNGLFATSACILCGLVVDVGNICVSKAELQRSSDAAALAGTAALLPKNALNGSGWSDPSAAANAAWLDAREYVRLNRCRSVTMDLLPEDMALTRYKHDANDPAQSEFINDTSYNSARVTVRRDSVRNGPIPLYFGPIVGIPSVNAMAEAAAFLEKDFEGFGIEPGSGTTCKLLPFSLWEGLWDERVSLGKRPLHPQHRELHRVQRGDGIYEISLFPDRLKDCPGNFGTVDIGSPNNSTSDLSRQILYGPNAWDFSFFPNSEIRIAETDPEEPSAERSCC
jgi:hypothetical protein